VAFHPNLAIVGATTNDGTIRIYDLERAQQRTAVRVFEGARSVLDMTYHPSGNYLLVGVDEPIPRIVDIQTGQAFVPQTLSDSHRPKSIINGVVYGREARVFATCGSDGDVRLWDGVSARCFAVLAGAHAGREVYMAQFSRNGKYLLTSGGDDTARLWDVSARRCIVTYEGIRRTVRAAAAFKCVVKVLWNMQSWLTHAFGVLDSFNESVVISTDDRQHAVHVFHARTGRRLGQYTGVDACFFHDPCSSCHSVAGHHGHVRHLAAAPDYDGFLTCCEDTRFRYWALDAKEGP
jgi:cleavage stimulation factor subunit 1